ncbi:LptF/LptG family permease [Hydrogenimonas sp. SS33]|uniref:LptF/LptG family permease n=1 Tax=Hydrogenimonas leucolamina TaxID=2954236 RepID=UPI00336C1CB7
MRMFRYVARLYLKYIFIIAFALSFLFAGLDYLQQAGNLEGFNIKVLYFFYKGAYAFDLLFPLTLVFAMIVAKIVLVRSNAIMSFYALGYSKKALMAPFIAVSLVALLLYIALHNTSFVDAQRSAKMLLEGKKKSLVTKNLFVKYNRSFIYIGELIPSKREALDIRIYSPEGDGVKQVIYGKKARFDGEKWIVSDAVILTKPRPEGLGGKGFATEHAARVETLHGFKPKILTSIFKGKESYTVESAYEALKLLLSQKLKTDTLRNLLYHMLVMPFFALFLVMLTFLGIPPYARSANLVLRAFLMVGVTLFSWGILYLLFRFARAGVIPPEAGTLPFIALLALLSLYGFFFRTNRI